MYTLRKGTLLVVSILTILSSMTLSPDLPGIHAQFHTLPHADLWTRLVLTIHALFIALGAPLAGYIIDRLGRKPLLLIATIVYGGAGISGLFLNELLPLLVSRVFLGLATAGTMTAATTLIADYYTGSERSQVAGWQTAAMNFGGVFALLLAGLLADRNWHFPFAIYGVSFLLIPLVISTIIEPPSIQRGVKNSSLVERFPWSEALILYITMLVAQILFFFVPVQLPFYLQKLIHSTATQSGVAVAAATLCTGCIALLYPKLNHFLERRVLIAIGFAGLSGGLLILGIAGNYPLIVLGALFTGVMMGILLPTLSLWILALTPSLLRGRAVSGLTASMFLGQFLSPFISQPLSQWGGFATMYSISGWIALVVAGGWIVAQRFTVPALVKPRHG